MPVEDCTILNIYLIIYCMVAGLNYLVQGKRVLNIFSSAGMRREPGIECQGRQAHNIHILNSHRALT